MKETPVSLKRTRLLSAAKKSNLSNNHVESIEKKAKCPNVNLKLLREENLNRIIFAQININSVRNKFQFLASKIISNVDAWLVSETKLDHSFPTAQFLLDWFSEVHRQDRWWNGGRINFDVKDDILSRLLTEYGLPDNVECFFIEINVRNKKWLLCCSYDSHKIMHQITYRTWAIVLTVI